MNGINGVRFSGLSVRFSGLADEPEVFQLEVMGSDGQPAIEQHRNRLLTSKEVDDYNGQYALSQQYLGAPKMVKGSTLFQIFKALAGIFTKPPEEIMKAGRGDVTVPLESLIQ